MDEMEDPDCLTPAELALWVEGKRGERPRDKIMAHLASCERCRALYAIASALPAEDQAVDAKEIVSRLMPQIRGITPVTPRGAHPILRRLAWPAAAAALLLAWGIFQGVRPGKTRDIPPGRQIAGREESVRTGPEAAEALRLPDGSWLRLAPSGEIRFRKPASGERIVAELLRGTLEADIAKAPGAVRILAAAGEICVVGTRFAVKAFRIHEGAGGIPVLSVEVAKGAVDLVSPKGIVRVSAGRRGIACAPFGAVVHEARPVDWRAAAREFGPAALKKPAGAWERILLLSATWQGISDWLEALSLEGVPTETRRLAAELAGVAAEVEDRERLLARFWAERDPSARLAFLPHAARVSGAEETAFLERVAASDPDEEVRRLAEKLRQEAE